MVWVGPHGWIPDVAILAILAQFASPKTKQNTGKSQKTHEPFRILANHTGALKRANFGEERLPNSWDRWNNATYKRDPAEDVRTILEEPAVADLTQEPIPLPPAPGGNSAMVVTDHTHRAYGNAKS